MAGSESAITTINMERENHELDFEISAAIDEWQVEYARFINCGSFAFKSTHPSLIPKINHQGNWISANAAASVKLIYEKSSAGTDDAVLVLSFRSKVLELHYISKLSFSWPQVSCMSGFPARGSRAVFLSYKDSAGKIQKFALRFSAVGETEKFMNLVKEIMKTGSPLLLQCPELNSEMSSQAEAISSHVTASNDGEFLTQSTQSIDNSSQLLLPSSPLKSSQTSPRQELGIGEATKTETVFPPSFTQLLNSCRPAVAESRLPSSIFPSDASLVDYLGEAMKAGPGNLKTQFVQYLEATSFQELLATVENVISQLGDDGVL